MIAVLGGGITGLALGHELGRLGADFVVLEGSARAGGVIRSARVEGRVLEWGPQRTRMTRGIADLVRELGLEGDVITAPSDLGLYVYRSGRLHAVPFAPVPFLRSGVVGWGSKLRLLLEPFTGAARPDETVASYFTRKVGREVYETLIAPLYGGLYASDPSDMVVRLSLAHVLREFDVGRSLLLPLLRRGGRIVPPAPLSFRDGMQTLPDALARSLGGALRLSTPARGLRRAPGGGWRVELDGGSIEAEHVVVTVPAPAASGLLAEVAPEAATRLRALRYNGLGVVHLDAETPLTGLGFQVAFTEQLALRGVTYNHSLFGRTNVYTAYLGGARRPDVVDMDDASLAALAVDEFRRCTGYESRPLAVAREWMPAWDRTWSALDDWSLPAGVHVAANWWTRPGIPGRLVEAKRTAAALAGAAAPVA